MSKYCICVLAGVLAAGISYCGFSPNADGQLTNREMSLIRGSAPPAGCKEYRSLECGSDLGSESTCQACMTASQPTNSAGTFYPNPGSCATSGTRYANKYSFSCDLTGPSNNLICPNGQSLKCVWEVACNAGQIANDVTCGLPAGIYVDSPWERQCVVNAPPIILPGSNGNLVTRTACRVCSTGADNGNSSTAAFNMCKPPTP